MTSDAGCARGPGRTTHGARRESCHPVRRYRLGREYRLHGAATGLLYARLLDPVIFDWLSDHPDLWATLLYVLAGQYEHADGHAERSGLHA